MQWPGVRIVAPTQCSRPNRSSRGSGRPDRKRKPGKVGLDNRDLGWEAADRRGELGRDRHRRRLADLFKECVANLLKECEERGRKTERFAKDSVRIWLNATHLALKKEQRICALLHLVA